MSTSGVLHKPTSVPTGAARVVNPWIVAISVMFATFMEVLDTTVVNVSLPHIAGNLSASIDEATWVLTSYLVANAIILPITGWLARFLGRKRLLMLSVMGFTVSSFLCGLAPSLPLLVIFRILQGAAGGCLQPLSQAVLLEAFPPDDRGKAMAFWGLGIVVAPILGPVMGGWLTDNYSWRWVFYINIPVGVISLIMTQRFVWDPPYLRFTKAGKIDYWGIGFLAVAIGALQILLDKGQEDDWFASHFIDTLAVIAALGMIAFITRELVARSPVVHLNVFKDRTFASGVLVMTVMGFVLYGSLVLLPIWMQTLLGYPSVQAGIALAPRGMGAFIAMPLVGALLARGDARKFLAAGIVIASGTMYSFSRLNLNAGYWDFFWPQFVQGISLALLFVPLTTVSMSRIPREEMGNATSIFNLLRNLGGSFGIAAVTAMSFREQQAHTNFLVERVTPYNPQAGAILHRFQQMMQAHGSGPVNSIEQSYIMMWNQIQQQAAILSYIDVFEILCGIFLAVVPLILFMKRPPRGAANVAAH